MCISLLKFVVKMGLNRVEELFKRAWGNMRRKCMG